MKLTGRILHVVLAAAILLVAAGCAREKPGKELPTVICSTSRLGAIAQAVGGDSLQVETIVPFGMCPGHFDISPGQTRDISRASLLLAHGWEPFRDKLAGITEDKVDIHEVNTEGSWMVPAVHVAATKEVLKVLEEVFPENRELFQSNANSYIEKVKQEGKRLEDAFEKSGTSGKNVLCSGMQKEFVEWAGFSVKGTYGRGEDMSVADIRDMVNRGKENGVVLVIDNLQSGKDGGTVIVNELQAGHVTLSNFPAEHDGRLNYLFTLNSNAEALIEALERFE